MKTLLTLLSEPLGLIALTLTAALSILVWRNRSRSARPLAAIAVVVFGVFTTPLGANILVKPLESRANLRTAQCDSPSPGRTLVILLSGGIAHRAASLADIDAIQLASFRRTVVAVERVLERPDSLLLISGGGSARIREADLLRELARRLGVPSERIITESESKTTFESAVAIRAQVDASGPERTELVTSAMHMPRALASLNRAGIAACPVPADFQYIDTELPQSLLPQISALVKSTQAMHEYVGWAVYALRGRT